MSSEAYREAYKHMTGAQKEAINRFRQRLIDHDGYSWVRYSDIEDVIATLVMYAPERDHPKKPGHKACLLPIDLCETLRERLDDVVNGWIAAKAKNADLYRWHDLRKDYADLPPDPECGEDTYVVKRKDVVEPYTAFWDGDDWYFYDGTIEKDIIGWKRIEPFEGTQ